jgi:hypothetical protein
MPLSVEQQQIVNEFVQVYDINPDDILFYSEKPEPFFNYKANCVLINRLLNPLNMQVLPFEPETADSIARSVIITLQDAHTRLHATRSSVGVVNLRETINGEQMSLAQREELAAARAMRQTLRLFGIDLFKLHSSNGQVLDFHVKSNKAAMLGQAHQLGKALFWISGNEKSAWYFQLATRYNVQHSNELTDIQLSDFVAFMRSLITPQALAA